MTQFYDWYEKIVLKIDKYKFVDGLNSAGYLLRPARDLINYRYIDWRLFLGDQYKSVANLYDGYYKDKKY